MTVVTSKEFVANEERYFELALNEQVYIQKDKNIFQLMCTNADNEIIEERVYCKPDEDFYRSITMDEFKQRALVMTERIDKMYAKR